MYLALDGGPPRFKPDFSCPTLLRILLESHPIFIDGTITLCGRPFQGRLINRNELRIGVLQPHPPKRMVWADPRSLAATKGISNWFILPSYLDVSVHWASSIFMVIQHNLYGVSPFGHPRVKACLAARRGLSQLAASFIGILSQGIHLLPFLQCHNVIFPLLYSNQKR